MQILGKVIIVWVTIVNMTTLFCILRYFGELRELLIVEDGFDLAQNGIFAIFCIEQVPQSKIVNAKNLAYKKQQKKTDHEEKERKKQLNERKESSCFSARHKCQNFFQEKE